jgi:transposase
VGGRLRIFLTSEENRTLFELRRAATVPQRVKDRAEVLRLNHQGCTNEKIAAYFQWNIKTVRQTLHRWQEGGLGGVWDAPHRGAQRRWQPEDIEHLESCLRQEQRTYNSHQLAQKLASERQVYLSADHLRRLLKKRGSSGSELDIVTETNKILSKELLSKRI